MTRLSLLLQSAQWWLIDHHLSREQRAFLSTVLIIASLIVQVQVASQDAAFRRLLSEQRYCRTHAWEETCR